MSSSSVFRHTGRYSLENVAAISVVSFDILTLKIYYTWQSKTDPILKQEVTLHHQETLENGPRLYWTKLTVCRSAAVSSECTRRACTHERMTLYGAKPVRCSHWLNYYSYLQRKFSYSYELDSKLCMNIKSRPNLVPAVSTRSGFNNYSSSAHRHTKN